MQVTFLNTKSNKKVDVDTSGMQLTHIILIVQILIEMISYS